LAEGYGNKTEAQKMGRAGTFFSTVAIMEEEPHVQVIQCRVSGREGR
jgi:hypothetical protein